MCARVLSKQEEPKTLAMSILNLPALQMYKKHKTAKTMCRVLCLRAIIKSTKHHRMVQRLRSPPPLQRPQTLYLNIDSVSYEIRKRTLYTECPWWPFNVLGNRETQKDSLRRRMCLRKELEVTKWPSFARNLKTVALCCTNGSRPGSCFEWGAGV